MTGRISRRAALAGLLGTAGQVALGDAAWAEGLSRSARPVARGSVPKSAPSDLVVADAGLGGRTCFAVSDLKSGEYCDRRTMSKALPPASVAKIVTAVYALSSLGADYQFRTELRAEGAVTDGVLTGSLVLAGGGDPVLDTDRLATLVDQLALRGIKGVSGAFEYADGALPDLYQIDDTQPNYVGYNPSISGLNLNFNRVHFDWKPAEGGGWNVLLDARGRKHVPKVSMVSLEIVERSGQVFGYSAGDRWTVAESALGRGGARWLPVRQPGLYTADVFRALCAARGIALPAPKRTKGPLPPTIIAETRSPKLEAIARGMLKYSTNLTAEVLGLAATQARNGAAATLAKSGAEMNGWCMSTFAKPFALADHSGLSGNSRATAQSFCGFLAQDAVRDVLKPLLKPHKLRDANRNVIENGPVSVVAKTGSLNFVSSLAGYVTRADGKELTFAVMSGDIPRRDALPIEARARPRGGRSWQIRARKMQQQLIQNWGAKTDA